jgi:hypothetical protein
MLFSTERKDILKNVLERGLLAGSFVLGLRLQRGIAGDVLSYCRSIGRDLLLRGERPGRICKRRKAERNAVRSGGGELDTMS